MDEAGKTQASDGTVRDVFELEETVKGWDDDYYHPIAVRYYDRAVPDMLRAMGVKLGDHVVDAGCGPGVHAIRAANYGCSVTAIDLSERMLAHARERAKAAGVADQISFQQDDLTNLKLQGPFPFVFNWGVIIHIPDTMAALDHLSGLIMPGGKLALHVSNRSSLDFRLERLARWILRKPFQEEVEIPLGHGIWYDNHGERLWVLRFDAKALTDEMARRGFKRISHRAAEYTELQWRLSGFLRRILLHANGLAYILRAPVGLSCTQILVFEKEK